MLKILTLYITNPFSDVCHTFAKNIHKVCTTATRFCICVDKLVRTIDGDIALKQTTHNFLYQNEILPIQMIAFCVFYISVFTHQNPFLERKQPHSYFSVRIGFNIRVL